MEPFRYHVYVCMQEKPEGVPSCPAHGSAEILEGLRHEIVSNGLAEDVQVTTCGSLGLCENGPNMVVYPEGVWYSHMTVEDVPEIVKQHFKEGVPVKRLIRNDMADVREEAITNRNKMMAAMKAKDDAGMLPDDFMMKLRGFMESRILLSSLELDIYTAVGGGATPEEVAGKIKTDHRATASLLNALAALGMLNKEDGVYRNSPLASRYLTDDGPDASRIALMHIAHLWPRWSTLTECIREGTSVTYKPMEKRDEEWAEAFIGLMDKNSRLRAPMMVRAVGIEGVKKMLDIGGGSGGYSIAFARAGKNLHVEILDLPTVAPLTRKYIENAGMTELVKARAGDFRTDDFGSGFDLVLISAICHMNGPQGNIDLLKKAYNALNPGGRVVIQDYILDNDKTSPKGAAVFAINMLVGTKEGSAYSEEEYSSWLREAGFGEIKRVRLVGPTGLIIGEKA